MSSKPAWTSMALTACLALPAAAGTTKLNIKTGLWEITSTSHIAGLPPLPQAVLDKMTAEQRVEMEAAFKAEAAKGPQVDTDRECITPDEVERPFDSADTEDCIQTVANTTPTSQEIRLSCHGEYEGMGVLKVTTPTPETMTGTLDLKLGEGEDAMSVSAKLKGRWLGPDCGSEGDHDEDEDISADDEAEDEDEEEEEEEEEEE